MASIRKSLQERLKLKVNEQKSAVDRPWKLKFLGYSMNSYPTGTANHQTSEYEDTGNNSSE